MLPKLTYLPPGIRILLVLMLLSFHVSGARFRVLQFNIWQEGTVVNGGFEAIVNEIVAHKADIITFSEVRNYHGTKFNERIVSALKDRGYKYYSLFSYDSGILSRFPVESFTAIVPEKDDHGSVYKAVLSFKGKKIAVYTAHLDYLNAANYLPRGYNGNTWKKLPSKISDSAEVLEMNLASERDESVRLLLADAAAEFKKNVSVIIGGDFNEPSHRDWNAATKDLFDHNGLTIAWHNTIALEHAGFIDAYREKYPDPLTHPGFTFPAYNKDIEIKKLIWAPDADDRDRIDFIFYKPQPGLKLKKIAVLGPQYSIVNSVPVKETAKDKFIAPQGVWPTDHKAILATFKLN